MRYLLYFLSFVFIVILHYYVGEIFLIEKGTWVYAVGIFMRVLLIGLIFYFGYTLVDRKLNRKH
ncbi:hypothetical protein M3689_15100 [Alkalihalophilus marmarensis]|jgi:hypothetical protein|uniref:Uncharacterized protein n=1 Tax=Alkalihalophilus marmarensis DSM 21297 TaxID=1188261 RepID=U6SQ68_9BACI|nr:hypothetical protein [Alkalihalophilus marmarensis]ERN53773.1 hypothetical protein A33I_09855 [Alkalihalophilus marmarensis DSM 21297]MCM3490641.1 hypothetical protein [Alkalihalophilus marmarensis]